MIWQGKVYQEPKYTTDAITEHALDFLEQNQKNPFFFMWLSTVLWLGKVVQEVHQNRHTAYYADKPMDSFPAKKSARGSSKPFRGEQSHQHAQLCRGHQRCGRWHRPDHAEIKELASTKHSCRLQR